MFIISMQMKMSTHSQGENQDSLHVNPVVVVLVIEDIYFPLAYFVFSEEVWCFVINIKDSSSV